MATREGPRHTGQLGRLIVTRAGADGEALPRPAEQKYDGIDIHARLFCVGGDHRAGPRRNAPRYRAVNPQVSHAPKRLSDDQGSIGESGTEAGGDGWGVFQRLIDNTVSFCKRDQMIFLLICCRSVEVET